MEAPSRPDNQRLVEQHIRGALTLKGAVRMGGNNVCGNDRFNSFVSNMDPRRGAN